MVGFMKRLALKSLLDKAKQLYEKGNTIDEIVGKFMDDAKVSEGLGALGIGHVELEKMIKEKVKEK